MNADLYLALAGPASFGSLVRLSPSVADQPPPSLPSEEPATVGIMPSDNPYSSWARGPSRGRNRSSLPTRSEHPSGRVIDLASQNEISLPGSTGRTRVLLVEDDPLFARLVASILEEVGSDFVVDHSPTLAVAAARLARDPIDLILTEINLPDSTGPVTVGAMRALAPGVPIVVLSDADEVQTAIEVIREGADEYIVKGRFSIDSLVWLVRLVLERHRRPAPDPRLGLFGPGSGLATLPTLRTAGQRCLRVAQQAGLSAGILLVGFRTSPRRESGDWEHLRVTVADLLQETLRRCDLITGLPGGELAALLVSDGPADRAVDRLKAALVAAGVADRVRIGFAGYDLHEASTVDLLLEQARGRTETVSS